MRPAKTFDLMAPTEIGERVRFVGYGGNVREWHVEVPDAEVVRFTRSGNAVVRLWGPRVTNQTGRPEVIITDTHAVAHCVDEDGKWLRPVDEPATVAP